jgi:hypothetical protein
MGKYTTHSRQAPKPKITGVHPVMRGIGCIMIVVVPLLAYGAAVLLVNYGLGKGWPIPSTWLGRLTIHPFLLGLRNLAPIWNFLLVQHNLIANLIFALIITVVFGGIMSILYGYIYSIFGPPRYGPQDAPPIKIKVKRYKR